METAKVTSKGQITLPRALREKLNIKKGDIVGFTVAAEKAEIVRLGSVEDFYGSIHVKGEQDFSHIREVVCETIARDAAHEGK